MGELWLLHLLCMLPFAAPTTLLKPAWQQSLGLDLGVLAIQRLRNRTQPLWAIEIHK
jgi:hypothetical protein